MFRRSFLKFIGIGGTVAALAGCPRPLPGPDGGGTTPGGIISLVSSVLDVTGVVLPIMLPFFNRFIPDGLPKAVVLAAAEVVVRVGREWRGVAEVYKTRGGDACTLYSLTGAFAEALIRLARALVDAGFGWGVEIENLLTSLSLLMDRIIGRCAEDAGSADAGRLLSMSHVGDSVRERLTAFRDGARARSVALRPLPPLDPASLR